MDKSTALRGLAGLAQETRLDIFRLLVEQGSGGLSAGVIAQRLHIAGPTLSFHLKELSHAGLVVARQAGRFIYYAPDFGTVNGLVDYLTENCCQGASCATARAPSPRSRRKAS